MTGISSSQTYMPIVSSTTDERNVNVAQMNQLTMLPSSTMRTGLDPRPTRATISPPMMNAVLMPANRIPHTSTETSDSP